MPRPPMPSLHLIALDNPSPPDYGGAIDLYYKVLALTNAGVELHLHYFARHDRLTAADELRRRCAKIYAYPRRESLSALLSTKPYMVATRFSAELMDNLRAPEAPVLFDGLHVTGQFDEIRKRFPHRRLGLRAHNCEAQYYAELSRQESKILKRLYLTAEAAKIARYEQPTMAKMDVVFAIGKHEAEYFGRSQSRAAWLPPFARPPAPLAEPAPNRATKTLLYHANFEIAENRKAGGWLIDCLAGAMPAGCELWLAGRGVPMAWRRPNVRLIDRPVDMNAVISQADLIILPGEQRSGVKIKFLETVASGKPHLASEAVALGSGLEQVTPVLNPALPLWPQIERALAGEYADVYEAQRKLYAALYDPAAQVEILATELGL